MEESLCNYCYMCVHAECGQRFCRNLLGFWSNLCENRFELAKPQRRDRVHVSVTVHISSNYELTRRSRFLAFGWGCLFWQPLALQYGKRPVYLMSLLGTIATQIWTPFVTTNPHWILNKLLQGFFGAPIESLCQISIADVHFQHKRGRYISLYTLSLGGSSTMAPVFAGLISERQTWKWVPYLASILCAFSFLMCLFLMEETNYDRAYDVETEDRNGLTTSVSGPCSAFESRVGVSEVHGYTRSGSGGNVLSHPSRQGFLDRLHIFRKSDFRKKNRVARRAWAPIILFRFPIVVYTGFMYGSYLVWTNLLNGTVAYVLGQSPYNFGASSIGLSYLSAFVGVFCGCLYTGWFGDKFAMWMAKRNCGFYEPEHRLWLIVPSVFAVPCGLTLWGIGKHPTYRWLYSTDHLVRCRVWRPLVRLCPGDGPHIVRKQRRDASLHLLLHRQLQGVLP
jgi:MFS family permease